MPSSDSGPILMLGSSCGEHLALRPTRRELEGWICMVADVRVGGFSGHVEGNARAMELSSLRTELRRLHEMLAGEVIFDPIDGWIDMRFVGDGRGHIEVQVQLRDRPGIGSTLSFTLRDIDQTDLPGFVASIDQVLANSP